jgi:hypothetical protein
MINKRFPMRVALAVYTPEEYAKLLSVADDARELDETWEEWRASMQKAKAGLAEQGIVCVPVSIEIAKLTQYCLEHNQPNNSGTRAEYAAKLFQERNKQQHIPRKSNKRKRR